MNEAKDLTVTLRSTVHKSVRTRDFVSRQCGWCGREVSGLASVVEKAQQRHEQTCPERPR